MNVFFVTNEAKRLATHLTRNNVYNLLPHAVSSSGKHFTREELYWIARFLIKSEPELVNSNIRDELGEFVTGLIGHVATNYILKLPTDPEDLSSDEFIKYVRDYRWARDPTTIWPGARCGKCDAAGNLLSEYQTEQMDAGES